MNQIQPLNPNSLYSQHLATPKRAPGAAMAGTNDQRSEGAQERSVAAKAFKTYNGTPVPVSAPISAALDQPLEALSAPLTDEAVLSLDRYPCPHCGAHLASGRAVGAAKTNGYCQYCKAERKAA